jgi:hypothetical protein
MISLSNVAEPIENALVGKNMARSDEIIDDRVVHKILSVRGLATPALNTASTSE